VDKPARRNLPLRKVTCCLLFFVRSFTRSFAMHAAELARLVAQVDEQATLWSAASASVTSYMDAAALVLQRLADMSNKQRQQQHLGLLTLIDGFPDALVRSQCHTLETLLRAVRKLLEQRLAPAAELLAEIAAQLEAHLLPLEPATPLLDDEHAAATTPIALPHLHQLVVATASAYAREYGRAAMHTSNAGARTHSHSCRVLRLRGELSRFGSEMASKALQASSNGAGAAAASSESDAASDISRRAQACYPQPGAAAERHLLSALASCTLVDGQ